MKLIDVDKKAVCMRVKLGGRMCGERADFIVTYLAHVTPICEEHAVKLLKEIRLHLLDPTRIGFGDKTTMKSVRKVSRILKLLETNEKGKLERKNGK